MSLTQIFLAKIPDQYRPTSKGSTLTAEEYDQIRAESLNQIIGNEKGFDCPLCLNRGYIAYVRPGGGIYTRECECMNKRKNLHLLQESGLADLVKRYTFDAWKTGESWQQTLLQIARAYAKSPSGWFYAAGRPGTGKSHICTAICGELMLQRGYPARYVLWRDFSVEAKALVNDAERYRELLEPVKKTRLLYLDDFMKTGSRPTTGDVNLAFEIINARYNDTEKITVISSEITAAKLLQIDEALGSRIMERARNNYFDLSQYANFRLT